MPGTLCSLWAGVDWRAVDAGGLGSGGSRLEEALADGLFSQDDHHVPGIWIVGERTGGGNIGHAFGVDGTDERNDYHLVADRDQRGRQSCHQLIEARLLGSASLELGNDLCPFLIYLRQGLDSPMCSGKAILKLSSCPPGHAGSQKQDQ